MSVFMALPSKFGLSDVLAVHGEGGAHQGDDGCPAVGVDAVDSGKAQAVGDNEKRHDEGRNDEGQTHQAPVPAFRLPNFSHILLSKSPQAGSASFHRKMRARVRW